MTPTYDPITKTWFTDDGREAPTLAILAAKIQPEGRGIVIEDYYPNGVPLEVIKQKMQEASAILGTDAPCPKASIPVMSANEDGGIVNEWKGGLPPARLGMPQDVSAPRKGANLKGRTRIYDWDAVITDRNAGLTYQQIADKRGMPGAGSVAGVVNAYNKQQRAAERPLV